MTSIAKAEPVSEVKSYFVLEKCVNPVELNNINSQPKKLNNLLQLLVWFIPYFMGSWLVIGAACAPAIEQKNSPTLETKNTHSSGVDPRLTVIWCFVGSRDNSESLKHALRSKLITHVAIFSGNRKTSNTLNKMQTRQAIDLVNLAEQEGVELILVRYLWQTQPSPDTRVETLSDVDYYVREINLLREEAKRIGAKYVGLDTESYGPTPIHDHFRKKRFSKKEYERLIDTVDKVIRRTGKVDFVLPAGSARRNHPYQALAKLGNKRIAEGTYYNNEANIRDIQYPYEIAGMYMNIIKENKNFPWKPYFLPSQVFGDKAHIWNSTDGLMIWPREHRASDVAQALADFASQRSHKRDEPLHGKP